MDSRHLSHIFLLSFPVLAWRLSAGKSFPYASARRLVFSRLEMFCGGFRLVLRDCMLSSSLARRLGTFTAASSCTGFRLVLRDCIMFCFFFLIVPFSSPSFPLIITTLHYSATATICSSTSATDFDSPWPGLSWSIVGYGRPCLAVLGYW